MVEEGNERETDRTAGNRREPVRVAGYGMRTDRGGLRIRQRSARAHPLPTARASGHGPIW